MRTVLKNGTFAKIFEKIRYFRGFIYNKQVKFDFPIDIIRQFVDYQWDLPADYIMRSPDEKIDLDAWADLLNSDVKFGTWTPERVKSDILSDLIAPDAASLLFYKNVLVGCSTTSTYLRGKRKIGMGMWLILNPAHQGKGGLARALTFRTLSYFDRENYEKVTGFTDPNRLAALYLYISMGFKPEYDSLYSFVQWWKIKKRLEPLLKREKRRKSVITLKRQKGALL